ncbi:hypothetical protein [Microbacterium sp. GXF7504]
MAKIAKLIPGSRDVRPPQSEVDGYFQTVDAPDGTRYLYLYNYASGGPRDGASPTQSIHFDRASAMEFRRIIDVVFGAPDGR